MAPPPLLALLALALACLLASPSGVAWGAGAVSLNASTTGGCELMFPQHNLPLEVFWINMDNSTTRRAFMTAQLKYYGLVNQHRVRAIVGDQVVTKFDRVDSEGCTLMDAADVSAARAGEFKNRSSKASLSHIISKHKLVNVRALCGRPKNSRKELVVALSHLNAINFAGGSKKRPIGNGHINSSEGVDLSQYALVLEDDLQFAFEIDFRALIAQAPKDFAVLQLVTSNDYSVLNLWRVFERHKVLFVKRKPHDDYWCAGAYIINKQKVFNISSQLLYRDDADGHFSAKIMTGYDRACHPKACCDNGRFIARPPCVKSARGYAADNLIFTLHEDTYILALPIMISSAVGNISTLHQVHVTFHQPAFHRMAQYTDIMASSTHQTIRSFINPGCRFQFNHDTMPL